MAFAAANVRHGVFGTFNVTCGDWSGAVGDAAGSIGVEGGRVYLAEFSRQDANQKLELVPVSVATSGNVTTVTVYNNAATTTGRFLIVHR